MTLRQFLDESGLVPEVEGVTGLMDGNRRDELVNRMPGSKIETRIQGALLEPLYPFPPLAGVTISFTYPSGVFLIETLAGSEIAFEVERALEYVPAGDRADVKGQFEVGLYAIRKGKPAPRFD